MSKEVFLAALVLFGVGLFTMSGQCFADAAVLLEQAKTYTGSGYRQQAKQLYNSIVQDYPGTDYALKAQSELIILDIVEKQDAEIQDAIDSLAARIPNCRMFSAISQWVSAGRESFSMQKTFINR